MGRMNRILVYLASSVLFATVLAGLFVARGGDVPFAARGDHWTIGIYSGESPFELRSAFRTMNPVLAAQDVTDVPARFVADPFLLRRESSWYLFFEVYNDATGQGDLAVAEGDGGRDWTYGQVVLDEPFHLSYPYVFDWEGETYLVPESFEAQSIRLYRARDFPIEWEFVTTLVEGRDYVDPSLAFYEGRWWMFAATTSNDTLHLFHADRLEGPWQPHDLSPVVRGDRHRARPSGRLLVDEGRLYRFSADVAPPQGTHRVFAYEITVLSPTEYAERPVREGPIVEPHGSGWTRNAMHHVDPHPLGDGRWIAAVDGQGPYRVFGWRY